MKCLQVCGPSSKDSQVLITDKRHTGENLTLANNVNVTTKHLCLSTRQYDQHNTHKALVEPA